MRPQAIKPSGFHGSSNCSSLTHAAISREPHGSPTVAATLRSAFSPTKAAASSPAAKRPRFNPFHAPVKVFPTQQQAYEYWDNQPCRSILRCFAVEVAAGGRRVFMVTSAEQFWRQYQELTPQQRCHYEIVREGSPCHLYFDLEFARGVNSQASGTAIMHSVVEGVGAMFKEYFSITLDTNWVLELDSSTPEKFSRHLIVQLPNTAFKDNQNAGRFALLVVLHLLQQTPAADDSSCQSRERHMGRSNNGDNDVAGSSSGAIGESSSGGRGSSNSRSRGVGSLLVAAKSGETTLAIDLGVYSRNRAFRLYLSSKAGKCSWLRATPHFGGSQLSPEDTFVCGLISAAAPPPVSSTTQISPWEPVVAAAAPVSTLAAAAADAGACQATRWSPQNRKPEGVSGQPVAAAAKDIPAPPAAAAAAVKFSGGASQENGRGSATEQGGRCKAQGGEGSVYCVQVQVAEKAAAAAGGVGPVGGAGAAAGRGGGGGDAATGTAAGGCGGLDDSGGAEGASQAPMVPLEGSSRRATSSANTYSSSSSMYKDPFAQGSPFYRYCYRSRGSSSSLWPEGQLNGTCPEPLEVPPEWCASLLQTLPADLAALPCLHQPSLLGFCSSSGSSRWWSNAPGGQAVQHGQGPGALGGAGYAAKGEVAWQEVCMGPSPFPEIEQMLLSAWSQDGVQGHIRSWSIAPEQGMVMYNFKGNRWCGNVGRQHASNGIYFMVNLHLGVWYQKCYDPECRHYRSQTMPLPPAIWQKYKARGLDPVGCSAAAPPVPAVQLAGSGGSIKAKEITHAGFSSGCCTPGLLSAVPEARVGLAVACSTAVPAAGVDDGVQQAMVQTWPAGAIEGEDEACLQLLEQLEREMEAKKMGGGWRPAAHVQKTKGMDQGVEVQNCWRAGWYEETPGFGGQVRRQDNDVDEVYMQWLDTYEKGRHV